MIAPVDAGDTRLYRAQRLLCQASALVDLMEYYSDDPEAIEIHFALQALGGLLRTAGDQVAEVLA